ncbi:carbon-nitrogen hydrolase family protein [Pseudoxanthomonas sp. 22568]|uniref:carbon-nitrogen hydrolase family protein n=1 Tax=Pseudoxanthomonas sp. 22568 TaxID=3453945 RepID=UPI003F832167
MNQTVRIAAVQLCTGVDVAVNNRNIARAMTEAAVAGARLVCLPEAANILLPDVHGYPAACVPEAEDSTLLLCRTLASELGIWVHTGSLLVRTEDDRQVWNRSHVISPSGHVVARYDKLHTFDVKLGGAGDFQESASVRAGENAPVLVEIAPLGLTLGLSICYDLRFPHLYRALAKAGANVLMVPASFSIITGPLHWETLLRARAIETGSYVVAPAQCGERAGLRVFGNSRVIAPFGEVLAGGGDEPVIVLSDLDPELVERTRQRLPSLTQDRPLPEPQRIRVPD